tara:strand:- start:557 stop:820 length:264 start_codon:yes stop_codon:yes gene_type:complete
MLGLGLSMDYYGSSGSAAVVIEDYMWESPTPGQITPLATGTVSDFHDTWDLDGTNYMPAAVADVTDEGYWGVTTISSGNDGINPIDV